MFFVVKPLIVPAGKIRYCPSLRARLLDIGQQKRSKNAKKNEANTVNTQPSSWKKLRQYSKDLLHGQKEIEDITRWREDMNFIFESQNNILLTRCARS